MDRSTATHFGAKVSNYLAHATTQNNVAKELAAQTIEHTHSFDGIWLDIGCGPAVVSSHFYDFYPRIHPILLDLSMATLTQLSPLHTTVCADMDALPFRAEHFNGITASSSFQWAASMETVIGECRRILQPRGTLSVAVFTEHSLKELQMAQKEFSVTTPVVFPSADTVLQYIVSQGFTILKQELKHYAESYITGLDAIRAISRIGAGFHTGKTFTPNALRHFVSYYESLFSSTIENRYSVTFITASRD